MILEHPHIFVLDIAERPAFAFAADNLDAAQRMVRSEWMLRALDAFCRTRRSAGAGQLQLRNATNDEARFYRDRADEFADATPYVLIAHLAEV